MDLTKISTNILIDFDDDLSDYSIKLNSVQYSNLSIYGVYFSR